MVLMVQQCVTDGCTQCVCGQTISWALISVILRGDSSYPFLREIFSPELINVISLIMTRMMSESASRLFSWTHGQTLINTLQTLQKMTLETRSVVSFHINSPLFICLTDYSWRLSFNPIKPKSKNWNLCLIFGIWAIKKTKLSPELLVNIEAISVNEIIKTPKLKKAKFLIQAGFFF